MHEANTVQTHLRVKQIRVRYGRNYKVVFAIVLPCLLIIPFVFTMQAYKSLDEWKIWLIIFLFLGSIMSLCLWLVTQVYPPTILRIYNRTISLSFNRKNFLAPADFSFTIADITSFTRKTMGDEEYVLLKTSSPVREFQVSAFSDESGDYIDFGEAMDAIAEMLQPSAANTNPRIK